MTGGLGRARARRRDYAQTFETAAGRRVLRDLYRDDLPNRLRRIEQEPGSYLRPGTWLAVARASPFIEAGLDGLDRRTEKAVIYGIAGDLSEP